MFRQEWGMLATIPDEQSRELVRTDLRVGVRNAVSFIRQQVINFQAIAAQKISTMDV